ncbi:Flocculation suppression protein [Xanthoria calcicola]
MMIQSPFMADSHQHRHGTVPILPSSRTGGGHPAETSNGEPMDLTPPASTTMGPPNSSPELDHSGGPVNGMYGDALHGHGGAGLNGLSAAAATSSQQPKVVQTAFIHKLYNMLEDSSIQNLISWSSNNESFVMSPSPDFSKVLAQYFKHTNISSFVRQLNMYGFHKVSDVFHTGSPDSALWEFKHGNGNFRRGDLAGLREIKRRASRHALIHRDSFSATHKPSVSQPGTPAEPVPEMSTDARIANLEHNLYELHARLVRTEESNTVLSSKCQALSDGVTKCHQWSHDISHYLISIVPDQDSPIRRDVFTMQQDIARQLEMMRHFDDPHESLLSGRHPHFSNMALDAPLSPRQIINDERRPSFQGMPPKPNGFRPPIPSHFTTSPRRYGSIGTANPPLPNYHRPVQPQPQPHPPPSQHPLASVSSPGVNLGRRHTSADIRVPGWPGHQDPNSPTASVDSSAHWPSSPHQTPNSSDQHIRDSLASYEFGAPRKSIGSHQATPPLTSDTTPSAFSGESGWSFGASKFPPRHLDSAPQTRRSSMASNVHSLLNPAETAERDEEDPLGPDDRKRKRMQ